MIIVIVDKILNMIINIVFIKDISFFDKRIDGIGKNNIIKYIHKKFNIIWSHSSRKESTNKR
jgi:hypothetical protein